MATSSFPLISALRSSDFTTRYLPDEIWRHIPPLIRRRILLRDLMSQKPTKPAPNLKHSLKHGEELRNRVVVTENSEAKAKAEAQLSELELKKLREDLEVTDDIVNSEANLHALFLKWLSYFDHHFDVEDEKAFKFRLGLFKDNARFINQWNKSGRSSTCGLNQFSDMTRDEIASYSWKIYPKKANQVIPESCIAGISNMYGHLDGGLVVRNFIAPVPRCETSLTVQAPNIQARSFCYADYKPVEDLPEEVTLDIFSRLPVESVLNCKLVCKAWRDLLKFHADNIFADLHLQRQHYCHGVMQKQEQHEQFLNSEPMSFVGFDGHSFYYAEYHDSGEIIGKQPNYQTKKMNLKFPEAVHGFVGSCNGLICLSVKSKYKTLLYDENGIDTYFTYLDEPSYICNPITREYMNLPVVSIDEEKSRCGVRVVHGFGYYPPTKEYKVVRISYFGNTNKPPFKGEVKVYTLGCNSAWRSVGETNYLLVSNYSASVCVDGALHWLQKGFSNIVAFDLGVEEFYLFTYPCTTATLCVINGFLCVLSDCMETLWFLRKNNCESWSWRLVFTTRGIAGCNVLAFTKRDEILLGRSGKVIQFNLETRTSNMIFDRKSYRGWRLPHSHVNSFVSLNALGENTVTKLSD